MSAKVDVPGAPVFGFLAFTSGSYEGAIIRDMRLANALHRRGYRVHVYWMMESNRELVDPGIPQSMLASAFRYYTRRPSSLFDTLGRLTRLVSPKRRRRHAQQHPELVDRFLMNLARAICDGDARLSKRITDACRRDGVTHLLPTFAMTCPFVEPAKRALGGKMDYVVTFQGEEIFANFASRIGRLDDYFAKLRATVEASGFPAVAVSRDYIDRLTHEVGLDASKVQPIYPGIVPPTATVPPPFEVLQKLIPALRSDRPLISYVGRQDPEKGLDLLLYAVRMLRDRGHEPQLFIAGGTSFGQRYQDSCKAIGEHLRVPIFWKRRVSDEARDALYAHSRCIVYPAIHREPFGMVAAEAMSYGTPVLIPNLGGITEVIEVDGRRGGLTFQAWDSADLSRQLERLLTDDALHAELKTNTRWLASQFTVDRMTDAVLKHVGL